MSRTVLRDTYERRASRIDFASSQDRDDAGCPLCVRGIQRRDLGVRMRTPDKTRMQHPRQLDVVNVTAVSIQEPLELAPRHACADTRGGFGPG
jgi:hypothetical protein